MKIIPSWLASISIHATLILLLTFTISFRQKYEKAKPMPVYEAYIALSRGDGRAATSQFPQSNAEDSVEEDITFPKVDIKVGTDTLFSSGSSEINIESGVGAGALSKLPQGKGGSRHHSVAKKSGAGGGGGNSGATYIGLAGVNKPPPYPDVARRNGWEGRVLLIVKVSPDGRAKSVAVKESSGCDILDKSASDTIATWLFQPAKINDVPVEGIVEVPIRFKLK